MEELCNVRSQAHSLLVLLLPSFPGDSLVMGVEDHELYSLYSTLDEVE